MSRKRPDIVGEIAGRRKLSVPWGSGRLPRLAAFGKSGSIPYLSADALDGWNAISFEAMTRGGTTATEWVWFNFPEPTALHDYSYLGDDFRERERIKRKNSDRPVVQTHAVV